MKLGWAVAALLSLPACAPTPANNQAAETGTFRIILESEDAIDGRRPVLGFVCDSRGVSLWFGLVRQAIAANPHAIVKVADQPAQRLPIRSLGEDKWALGLSPADTTALARAIIADRAVYFLGPEGTTERAYRWDLARFGSQLDEVVRRCG